MSSLIASEDLLRSLALALSILALLHLDLLLLRRRLLYIPFFVVNFLASLLATLAARRGPLLRRGFGWSSFGWSLDTGVAALDSSGSLSFDFVLCHTYGFAGAGDAAQTGELLEFLVVDLGFMLVWRDAEAWKTGFWGEM